MSVGFFLLDRVLVPYGIPSESACSWQRLLSAPVDFGGSFLFTVQFIVDAPVVAERDFDA